MAVIVGISLFIAGVQSSLHPCRSWTFHNYNAGDFDNYGEIDILEAFNDITQNYVSLHTSLNCTFKSPTDRQTGMPNNDNHDCNLSAGAGCSVLLPPGSYGAFSNAVGGGVYAMQWTSRFIKIWFFPKTFIPGDTVAGEPDPGKWSVPTANFDSRHDHCDVKEAFPPRSIVSSAGENLSYHPFDH